MLTIAWDVDDVLNDLMRSWLSAWKRQHPECRVEYAEITENPPDRVLGITRKEYLVSLDAFRISKRAAQMEPNPIIVEWMKNFGIGYRHVALTARPLASTAEAADWVFRHFGAYIRSFGVVPVRLSAGLPVYDADKGDFLRWAGNIDVLIDDSEDNLRAAERSDVRGILYPQPWNHSTQDVREALESLTEFAEAH
ncbi:MAG TPA: hypothetical protein VMU28_12395 [Terriglobales bacterium]|nr:hypothetical protein [Terriglobales bacterium]